ncbi:tail fiber protein [Staphylococcus phage ZCSS1]|nr:tail fiber protein [Staphylococcus phage ZCSS1]
MALNNFKPLTQENNVKDMSDTINMVGEELTKPRNVFELVSELQVKVNNSQLKAITTDNGLSKIPTGTRILDVKDVGVYFYSASILATKTDKPELNSQDSILVVTPTNSSSIVVQHMYPLTTSGNAIQHVYRVVVGNTAGDWVYQKGLVGGNTNSLSGVNLNTFNTPGEYFVDNVTGLPDGESEGLLKVYRGNRNQVVQEFISGYNKIKYYKISSNSTGWIKELEPKSLSKYTLGGINEDGQNTFGLLIYISDNKTFQQAITDHIAKTGQPTFTFYVQGGVPGNPSGTLSGRGIFVCESTSESALTNNLYGVYHVITTLGTLITGSVIGGDWRIPKGSDSTTTLWTGVKEFTSKTTEKMNYSSNDFDYFKVYVTIGGTNSNSIYRQAFEFGKHSANKLKVSSVNVPSSGSTLEYFMCSISFDGDKFTIDEYNTKTNGKCYVTEIVGIKRPV